MSNNDNYYRRRFEEELVAAETAACPSTAMIHRELARRYRELLETKLELVVERPPAANQAGSFNSA